MKHADAVATIVEKTNDQWLAKRDVTCVSKDAAHHLCLLATRLDELLDTQSDQITIVKKHAAAMRKGESWQLFGSTAMHLYATGAAIYATKECLKDALNSHGLFRAYVEIMGGDV